MKQEEIKYPEHEKLLNLQGNIDFLKKFLIWLGDKKMFISERSFVYETQQNALLVQHRSADAWVSEFLNINIDELAKESVKIMKIKENELSK